MLRPSGRQTSLFSSIKDLPKSIWALFAVRLVVAAGNFVFPFLTLILTSRLGWGAAKAGAFISIMQAAALPGVLAGGKLSDTVGRKRIILICQAAASLLFFACLAIGFKPILPFLIAGASVALSMTWPISQALVADLVPPESRKTAYALLYWGNNIGFSLGPLAAGFLFHRAPSLMFLGNAAALCVSLLIVSKFVPELKPSKSGLISVPPAVKGAGESAGSGEAPAAFESAKAGGLLCVLRERPTILVFALLVALMNLVYSQNSFGLPIFLNEKLGLHGSEVFGAAMTANGLTVVLCTLLLTRLTSRWRTLTTIAAASALYGLGFGLLALPASLPIVLVSTVVWTLGEILSATNINVYVAARTPSSHRGRINALVSIVTNLGSLSGPMAAGFVIGWKGSSSIWPLAFILSLFTALLLLGLLAYDKARAAKPQS
jgi:MFS family permease